MPSPAGDAHSRTLLLPLALNGARTACFSQGWSWEAWRWQSRLGGVFHTEGDVSAADFQDEAEDLVGVDGLEVEADLVLAYGDEIDQLVEEMRLHGEIAPDHAERGGRLDETRVFLQIRQPEQHRGEGRAQFV